MLLLIFFIITSQYVVLFLGVKVKLPGSKTSEQVVPSEFVVTITKEGTFYLGETIVAEPELEGRLKSLRSTMKPI